jgi:hypothetical protein
MFHRTVDIEVVNCIVLLHRTQPHYNPAIRVVLASLYADVMGGKSCTTRVPQHQLSRLEERGSRPERPVVALSFDVEKGRRMKRVIEHAYVKRKPIVVDFVRLVEEV